jgi:hypothetical protein
MLGTLFPKVSKKCLALPLFGPVIEDFASWLVQQGYAHLHMRATLNVVRKVDRYLRRKGIHHIEDITDLALHHYWRTLRRRAPWEAGAVHIVERFLKMRRRFELLSGHHAFCPSSGGILRIPAGGPRIDAGHDQRAGTSR